MDPLLVGNFKGLQHIGVPVSDLTRSQAFYEKLGFHSLMSADFTVDGEQGLVAMLGRGEVVMELYQMPAQHLAEIRSRGDGRFDHVAFSVADVDAAMTEIREAGLTPEQNEPVLLSNFWDRGCRYFTIRGPDGEKLEFNQIVRA